MKGKDLWLVLVFRMVNFRMRAWLSIYRVGNRLRQGMGRLSGCDGLELVRILSSFSLVVDQSPPPFKRRGTFLYQEW